MKLTMQITKLFLKEGTDFDTEVARSQAIRAARNMLKDEYNTLLRYSGMNEKIRPILYASLSNTLAAEFAPKISEKAELFKSDLMPVTMEFSADFDLDDLESKSLFKNVDVKITPSSSVFGMK
jgi:hypothetical protein